MGPPWLPTNMVRSYTISFSELAVAHSGGSTVEVLVDCNSWVSDREVQLHALCGDNQQKLDTYRFLADFGPGIDRLFSRKFQSWYLLKYHPELVPPPQQPGQPPSEHTLSTVFEFYYYRSVTFSSEYMRLLPELFRLICIPTVEPVYSSVNPSN